MTKDWMRDYWRPAVGVAYIVICVCDFVIFPIAWVAMMAWQGTTVTQTSAWIPITLGSGGFLHGAFGVILGASAWGRSKEKISMGSNEYRQSPGAINNRDADLEPPSRPRMPND